VQRGAARWIERDARGVEVEHVTGIAHEDCDVCIRAKRNGLVHVHDDDADLEALYRKAIEENRGKVLLRVLEPESPTLERKRCDVCLRAEAQGGRHVECEDASPVEVGPYVRGQVPSSLKVPSSTEVPRPARAASSGGIRYESAYRQHYTEAEDALVRWYPTGIRTAHKAKPGGHIEHGPVHTPARDWRTTKVKPPLTQDTSQRGPWPALIGIVDRAWNWLWYDWRPYVWPSMRTPVDPATSTDPNVRYAGHEGTQRFLDDLRTGRPLAGSTRSRWR
jgi:hypothetical protein